jgi:uncharacterized heparinase superfamily protein
MPSLPKLSRVAWTVRYLKARQIGGQLRHQMIRSFERGGNGNRYAVVEYPGCAWSKDVRFLPPGAQENGAEAIRRGALRFLNREESVGFPPQWDGHELPKLWQYNLHYFEWLWVLDYSDAKSVVMDWIERHPPAKGAVGWEPYPTSLRLMNWCAVFWGRFRKQVEGDHAFLATLWRTVVRQAHWLTRHLETHLLGNHYLENGAALAFVGSCFRGEQASRWFEKGRRILSQQMPEQVLPDGTHFELSPMYHCRILYVLAMLSGTSNDRLKATVAKPLSRMLSALSALCHPDGRIALLNDSAFGIYNEPDELRSFCGELLEEALSTPARRDGCFALSDAGYYGWRDSAGNYVICDFGKIGPDYIPGHAHADLFTFELSLRGQRVVVDTGVHDYEVSEARRCCRSTAAHNTVKIDGQDQCEMWGVFRVARRGYPRQVVWQPSATGFFLSGWHDGYRRLPGRPIHSRCIQWDARTGLTVTDSVTASRSVKAESRLHLHPDCRILRTSAGGIELEHAGGRTRIEGPSGCAARIEEGEYYPQFGVIQKNRVIVFEKTGVEVKLKYSLQTMQ